MFVPDKGTRDLLPIIEPHPSDFGGLVPEFDGSPAPAGEVPLAAVPFAMQPGTSLPLTEDDANNDPETSSTENTEPSSSATAQIAAPADGNGSVLTAISIPLDQNFLTGGNPIAFTYRGGTGELERHEAGQGGHAGAASPSSHDVDGQSSGPVTGVTDDVHSIDVTQIIEVEQDASIFVSGYVGEVVARLYIDQDLFMEQDIDIDFSIDGDGHFVVRLDQETRIDQDIWVELKIYDEDGTLFVDVFLRDSIDIEQDTAINLQISNGPLGGTVEVNQVIELDQDVDIQIDIEDDLEQRYIVNASVEVRQTVDVDHDAVVGITDRDGEIDLDVDAVQNAFVDQETIVHADFALI
jgi:hypothetical protein